MAAERSGVVNFIFGVISIVEAIFNVALLHVRLLVDLLRRYRRHCSSIKQQYVRNKSRSAGVMLQREAMVR
jgi:hypothetical protein